MAEPSAMLLCIRVADARSHSHGSTQVECSRCSAMCWRAPSSAPDLPILCLVCFGRDKGPKVIAPLTEAQRAEVLSHFARGRA